MDKIKLSTPNIVILAAGAVMLIASFLAFYTYGSLSWSAWSSQKPFALFPLATLVALFGVLMAAQVAIAAFASGVKLPEKVLGLTWDQIHLALACQAVIMMIAFLIRDHGGASFGIGFWLLLLASIALVVGAVLRMQEKPAGATPPPPPAAS